MRQRTGSMVFVALVLGAVALGACRALPGETQQQEEEEEASGSYATVEIRVQGGMCPSDTFCGWLARASENDGSWDLVEGDEESSGAVDPAAVAEVADWFVDHHPEFVADEFAGECPTASDGPEATITVGTIPGSPLADAQYWSTAACQHAWPPALVADFLAVWDRAGIPRLDPVPIP